MPLPAYCQPLLGPSLLQYFEISDLAPAAGQTASKKGNYWRYWFKIYGKKIYFN
jgi:hypothetical protein